MKENCRFGGIDCDKKKRVGGRYADCMGNNDWVLLLSLLLLLLLLWLGAGVDYYYDGRGCCVHAVVDLCTRWHQK